MSHPSLFVFLCVCCASILASSNVHNEWYSFGDGYSNSAEKTAVNHWLRQLPRYDLNAKPLGSNLKWDPESKKYNESVLIVGLPFLAISLLSFIFVVIVLACNCCNCSSNQEIQNRPRKRLLPKAAVFCMVLLAGVCIAIGTVSNIAAHNRLTESIDIVNDTEDYIWGDLITVQTILQELNVTNMLSDVYKVMNETNDVKKITKDHEDQAQHYEQIREYSVMAVYALGFTVCAIAILAILCNSPTGISLMMFAALLAIPLLWILAGSFFSTSVYISDMCPEVEKYITNDTQASGADAWAQYYFNCEGTSPLQNVTTYSKKQLQQAESELAYAKKHHESPEVIAALEALVAKLQELVGALNDLSNCNKTVQAWDSLKEKVCTEVVFSFTMIAGSSVGAALCLSLAIVFAGVARKRFPKYIDAQELPLNDYQRASFNNTNSLPQDPRQSIQQEQFLVAVYANGSQRSFDSSSGKTPQMTTPLLADHD